MVIVLALFDEGFTDYLGEIRNVLSSDSSVKDGVRNLITTHLRWTAEKLELFLYLTRIAMAELP